MTTHYIKVCAYCDAVISQCRCPAPDKTKQVGVCAKCWHERREKSPDLTSKRPKKTETGLWRWTLVDLPARPSADELPKEVFDRLDSPNHRQPWLFDTEAEAIEALRIARQKQAEASAIEELMREDEERRFK